MNRPSKRILAALTLLLTVTGLAQAQTWTLIELPATIDELPAAVEQQLGYPLDEVPDHNLTHIKFTGKDLRRTGISSSGYYYTNNRHQNMYKLVQKAKVLDLSELQYNEDNLNAPDEKFYTLHAIGSELDQLQKMIYPKVAKRIDHNLRYCTHLTEVVWPTAAITSLPDAMFGYCRSLKSVTLPDALTVIAGSLFNGCDSLQSVSIPAGVTDIGSDAFEYCGRLEQLNLPEGLQSIGAEAFERTALREVVVPNSVTTMGVGVFLECDSLRSVTLPRGLSEIPNNLFRSCDNLQHVDMPRAPRRIGEHAFDSDVSLHQLDIPEGVTEIAYQAFRYCYLSSVRLPSTLRTLRAGAFSDADWLKEIDIPASVQIIGESCFSSCDSLERVTLHEGLLSIKDNAFNDSPVLGNVELPNSLRFMGRRVFCGNTRRTSFTLPPLLTEVPDYTCASCDSLETVILHDRCTRIGTCAFEIGDYWHPYNKLAHVTIPEGVTEIGNSAFNHCPLEEVNLPGTLKKIGYWAFNEGKYRRIVVPEGVEVIGERCFRSDSLRVADFPSTIRCLGGLPLGDGRQVDSIIVRAVIPPLYASWGYAERLSTFYVPAQSVDLYKADAAFNYVSNIKPLSGYQPGVLMVNRPFSTDSVLYDNSTGKRDLVLTLSDDSRSNSGQLYVAPQTTMNIGHYRYDYLWWDYYWLNQVPSLIPDGTMTADELEMRYWFNRQNCWQSLTAPFDLKVSDITCDNPLMPYTIRVWDGQARANGNHASVWRDVEADETLPAGTAFLLYCGYYPVEKQYGDVLNDIVRGWDESCTLNFRSLQPHNTTVFQNDDVTIPLPEHKAEFAHNAGWSMVGNPWQCYFDIQQLDSDAPILVLDQGEQWQQFRAVSPLDDELILRPLQSFLMQRSDQQTAITFTTAGRQADTQIHHETAVRQNSPAQYRRAQKRSQRVVYNATLLRQTEQGDSLLSQTRVVLNPAATAAYDRGLDAPFMTLDEALTGLYSLSGSLRYSINEQPLATTEVPLGMRLAEAGTYTLQVLPRRSVAGASEGSVASGSAAGIPSVTLIDRETGVRQDACEPYTFSVDEPCTLNRRFTLQLGDGITAVPSVAALPQPSAGALYDLQGRRVTASHPSTLRKGLYIQSGKKIIK